MDCSKIEKLLSLYVASDLENTQLSAVSLHLRSCHPCSMLADEYRESQGWLRSSCALPDFDRAFYNGVRSAVLEEINRSTAAPVFFWQRPALLLLRRRLALAAPAVLLLAASALAIYVSLGRPNLDAKHNRLATVSTSGTVKPIASDERVPQQNGLTREHLLAAFPPHRAPRISAVRKTSKRTPLRTKADTEAARAVPPSAAQPSAASAEQPVMGESIASTAQAITDQEATRIEIQTSDPNIRIIWLSPKGTK